MARIHPEPRIQPLIDSGAAARRCLAGEAVRWRQRLDVPARLRHSLTDHPAAWMLGALGAGLLASGWLRRKTPAAPPAANRKKPRGLPASLFGLALTAASPLAKAWLTAQLKQKIAGLSSPLTRSSGRSLPPFDSPS